MDSTLAALLGALIGGTLSVLASWLAQRIQSKSQLLVQEIKQRQRLYSDFVSAAACCFADALEKSEPDSPALAQLYGHIGRIRLISSELVVRKANKVAHVILDTYANCNRSRAEVRDFLSRDSIDLFSDFGNACRTELLRLQPLHVGLEGPLDFRIAPRQERKPR